jgi:hypothetical protein
MKKDAVKTGADAIAAAMDGPFGRRKFQSVVDEHLAYFLQARASGALWDQICSALTKAGVTSASGTPYKANALRVMVQRAEAKASTVKAQTAHTRKPELSVERSVAVHSAAEHRNQEREQIPMDKSDSRDDLQKVRERIQRAARLRGG